MLGLDPLTSTALISGGIFVVSFLIGKNWEAYSRERIIETTIIHLCDQGYIRHTTDEEGEITILKANGYKD